MVRTYLTALAAVVPLAVASVASTPRALRETDDGYLHFVMDKRRSSSSSSSLAKRQSFEGAMTQGQSYSIYTVNITVGTPPQSLAVQLDTGSSGLWVPTVDEKACKEGKCVYGAFDPSKSSTYKIIDEGTFNATYAVPTDFDEGNWVEESVTIGNSKTINNTIMGVALDGADAYGVWGVSFDAIEFQPLPNGQEYPGVIDRMVSEGIINRNAYSLYLNDLNETTGSVCFGCVDTTKYTGDLTALPLQLAPVDQRTQNKTAESFLVTLSKVEFVDAAGEVTQISNDADYPVTALLDSGTTGTAITNDALIAIANGFGAFADQYSNLYVPCSYSNSNASFRYTLGGEDGVVINVPVSELINPDAIFSGKEFPGHEAGGCILEFQSLVQDDVILGDSFLRSAYVVYDLENYQVAIAQAAGGKGSTSDIQVIPTGTSIPGVTKMASATANNLSGAAATSVPSLSTVTANTVTAGTPTFNLGSMATASNATPSPVGSSGSSGSETSSNHAGLVTSAPHMAMLGAVGFAMVL